MDVVALSVGNDIVVSPVTEIFDICSMVFVVRVVVVPLVLDVVDDSSVVDAIIITKMPNISKNV